MVYLYPLTFDTTNLIHQWLPEKMPCGFHNVNWWAIWLLALIVLKRGCVALRLVLSDS